MKRTNLLIFILFAMILLVGCKKLEDNTNSNMESKNATVVNENSGIQQFRMTSAFDSDFELDYQNHYIMAWKDVLLFPVTVSVDCKNIDTREKVTDDDWRITSIEGKIVTITKVGGIDHKVRLEDIVYFDTFKAAEQ